MDLAMVMSNFELGLYASAEMCVADIRLALCNARAVCRDSTPATLLALQSLAVLENQLDKELLEAPIPILKSQNTNSESLLSSGFI
jgi:hypothetical protein